MLTYSCKVRGIFFLAKSDFLKYQILYSPELVHAYRRTEGEADMTKLIVALRDAANVHKANEDICMEFLSL
jgi:hypothetical protein